MDKQLDTLNTLLVDTFNEILKVEEQSLRAATQSSVTVTEMHTWTPSAPGIRARFPSWPPPPR